MPGDARLIVEPGRVTLPSLMQKAGYRTGVVGQWHLGLGAGDLDWNARIKPGPLGIGFDSCFLIPATGDRVPCVYVDDGYKDRAVELLDGHTPAGPLRGGKYSAFDAGTRVPFLVRWPERVQPGVSDALVCQIDLLSSMAALTGQRLDSAAGPDSFEVSAALLGKSQTGRDHLVEHAGTLSLIKGDWKYIEPSQGARVNANTNTELGNDPQAQLYNLKNDLGEKQNLAAQRPEIVKEMATMLVKIRNDGRSRPP